MVSCPKCKGALKKKGAALTHYISVQVVGIIYPANIPMRDGMCTEV
jgi:hypothetical protein